MPSTNGHGFKPERVALYLRVSSEEQRERETIEIQREFLLEYCKLYGLEVADTYADDGVPGTLRMHERPEGRRLLGDAAGGRFDAVIVYRLDRLGRKLLVTVEAHDRLQEAGVALKSATEAIDTFTPSGRLIFQMLASFAEYDRQSIIERTRAGQRRAFKNGHHGGAIPYGYDIAPDGSFVVVEQEAAHVRQIIANIAEGGSSLYAETKRLNAEGVPSPGMRFKGRARTHGESWAHSSVRHIVNQRAYSGTHVVTLEGGETIERPVPAIVSPALQAKAQTATAHNRRFSGGKPGHDYLLRSLVFCEGCGASYVGNGSSDRRTGKRYSYYSCSRRKLPYDRRTERLTCPHVNAEWLEGMVWADVRAFLHNPGEVLERVRGKAWAAASTPPRPRRALIASNSDSPRREGLRPSTCVRSWPPRGVSPKTSSPSTPPTSTPRSRTYSSSSPLWRPTSTPTRRSGWQPPPLRRGSSLCASASQKLRPTPTRRAASGASWWSCSWRRSAWPRTAAAAPRSR